MHIATVGTPHQWCKLFLCGPLAMAGGQVLIASIDCISPNLIMLVLMQMTPFRKRQILARDQRPASQRQFSLTESKQSVPEENLQLATI